MSYGTPPMRGCHTYVIRGVIDTSSWGIKVGVPMMTREGSNRGSSTYPPPALFPPALLTLVLNFVWDSDAAYYSEAVWEASVGRRPTGRAQRFGYSAERI